MAKERLSTGQRRKGQLRIGVILALLSFLLIAAGSVFAFFRLKNQVASLNQTDFLRERTVFENELGYDLGRIQSTLFSLRAFFVGSVEVTRDEFAVFVSGQGAGKIDPSLFSLAFLKMVKSEDLPAFERQIGREIPGFSVFPAGERADHYPVLFDNPFYGTKPLYGLDPSVDPVRRLTFDRARDSGEVLLSEVYASLADPTRRLFLVTVPFYKKDLPVSTVEERRAALVGYAIALHDRDVFFDQVMTRLQPLGLDIEIFDGEGRTGEVIFDSNVQATISARPAALDLTETSRVELLGRIWTIFYTYHPQQVLTFGQLALPYLVLYGGLLFAFFSSLLIISLASSRSMALLTAQRMTEALVKFKLAVDNASSHIIITDADGKILYANPAAEMITGYSGKEMVGNNPRLWGGLMGKEFYERMWHQMKTERRPWKGELRNRRKNGEIYVASVTVSPILDETGELIGFVGLEDDVTLKEQATEALRKAKDEAILASIGDGVVVLDQEGKILLVNEAGCKLLGWKSEEMVGRLYTDVWQVKDKLGNLLPSFKRPIYLAMTLKKTVSMSEYNYTRKDGSDFPVHVNIAPIVTDGRLVGMVDVFHDISQERMVDRAKTEFVSLASHQLRTPLSAVGWYAEMLLSGDLGQMEPDQKKYLEEIFEANKRMVELVNALLNVSRIDLGTFSIEPEAVNLAEAAKSVVAELLPQITYKKLHFGENYDPNVPTIQADPKLVRIIFQNLLANAVKYSNPGGGGELNIRAVRAGETVAGKSLTQDGVLIKVADSGWGIPEFQKGRVFTKLFRADNVKEKDTEGTGLGLYVVKAIVEAADGQIWFESVENQGSTFYVFLPLPGMQKKSGTKSLTMDVFNRMKP